MTEYKADPFITMGEWEADRYMDAFTCRVVFEGVVIAGANYERTTLNTSRAFNLSIHFPKGEDTMFGELTDSMSFIEDRMCALKPEMTIDHSGWFEDPGDDHDYLNIHFGKDGMPPKRYLGHDSDGTRDPEVGIEGTICTVIADFILLTTTASLALDSVEMRLEQKKVIQVYPPTREDIVREKHGTAGDGTLPRRKRRTPIPVEPTRDDEKLENPQ